MGNKYFKKYLLSAITTVVIFYFLIKLVGGVDFRELRSFLRPNVILFSSLVYLFIKAVNTIRYNIVFKTKRFFKTVDILFYCNFVLSLIPFRIGEISYVSLFKKHYGIEYKNSVGNLIILRSFDYLSICFFLILFFLIIIRNGYTTVNHQLFAYPLYFSIIASASLIAVVLLIKRGSLFLKKIQKHFVFNHISNKEIIFVALMSLLYWFLRFNLGIYLFRSVGIGIGYYEIFFISTLMMTLTLIPIQTIAGFGVFEGGWVGVLVLFGISKNDLLVKIAAVHFLSLTNVFIFGVLSWIILHTLTQNKAHRTYSEERIS